MRVEIDPESRWPADVLLAIEPLISQPYDIDGWRRAHLARVAAASARATTTEHGFPMELAQGEGGIVALYRFVDHVAAAVARGPGLARHRDEVIALLRGARPDWRGADIVCLTELWE